jgi:hypothetical protein
MTTLVNTTQEIAQAHSYFETLGLVAADPVNPTIQDSDGLVSYIVASTNKPPASLDKLYREISPIMEGLTNVVVSAVIIKSGSDDKKKNDPVTWSEPMKAMTKAFCGGYSNSTQKLDQWVVGVEIATQFINLLMDAVVGQGAALADFAKFLQSQGEAIRLETSGSTQSYSYAAVSIVHELFEAADGRWLYVPKFKSYFTKFTKETLKISSGCVSFDKFHLTFDLEIQTGAFMVDTWQSDPEFQKTVKNFIQKFQKANIKDSENYFDGIFDSASDNS